MKINPDCIRKLLLHIESISNGRTSFVFQEEMPILDKSLYPWEEQAYHFSYCISQGYLEGAGISGHNETRVKNLSPLGHKVLDLIRDSKAWSQKLKPLLTKLGDCSLPIILQSLSEKFL